MRKKLLILTLVCMAAAAGKSSAQWKSDPTINTPVCTNLATEQNPQACSDNANGIIVVWEDLRGTGWHVFAQKLNSDGVPQWTADGINVSTNNAIETAPVVC